MSETPEIVRIIEIDDKTITVHIKLTEEEIKHLTSQVMEEMDKQIRTQFGARMVSSNSLVEALPISPLTGLPYGPDLIERKEKL